MVEVNYLPCQATLFFSKHRCVNLFLMQTIILCAHCWRGEATGYKEEQCLSVSPSSWCCIVIWTRWAGPGSEWWTLRQTGPDSSQKYLWGDSRGHMDTVMLPKKRHWIIFFQDSSFQGSLLWGGNGSSRTFNCTIALQFHSLSYSIHLLHSACAKSNCSGDSWEHLNREYRNKTCHQFKNKPRFLSLSDALLLASTSFTVTPTIVDCSELSQT